MYDLSIFVICFLGKSLLIKPKVLQPATHCHSGSAGSETAYPFEEDTGGNQWKSQEVLMRNIAKKSETINVYKLDIWMAAKHGFHVMCNFS